MSGKPGAASSLANSARWKIEGTSISILDD
jgi:hypothetical protein